MIGHAIQNDPVCTFSLAENTIKFIDAKTFNSHPKFISSTFALRKHRTKSEYSSLKY